ncbi:hypothetical protein [Thermocoleostomius sinensis]|jgi:hypothetical protein|uniref:Uncharacterized protein n=1 Tax=Thermocoleostomius sinensis A174 TaxID=2016057 RepID=A0A9E8ZCV1_9CYAN|nr:hypothetical protein [Thermocoleostomius sinensis]WAL60924.1 hypothetical protein OXH18_02685 [Thermocoleostomius sinensis A174]
MDQHKKLFQVVSTNANVGLRAIHYLDAICSAEFKCIVPSTLLYFPELGTNVDRFDKVKIKGFDWN